MRKTERVKRFLKGGPLHNLKQAPVHRFDYGSVTQSRAGTHGIVFGCPWEQGARVVVLSVVKTGTRKRFWRRQSGDGFVEIHAEWAKQQGVSPLRDRFRSFSVDWLATMGGSALDLLIILNYLRYAGAVPEEQVVKILREYRSGLL